MIFGRRSPVGRTAHRFGYLGLSALVAAFCILVPTVGCGGGSQSGPSPQTSATPGGANDAIVTGRVVDQNSNSQPVGGAIITYLGRQVTTAGDGTFQLSVPPSQSNVTLTVRGANSDSYYDTGYVNGQAYNLRSSGFTLPALQNQQQYSVGDIALLNTSAPPPPPVFPQ